VVTEAPVPRIGAHDVRVALRSNYEIALIDVREEGAFAKAHPLFAASLPLGRVELEVLDRVPRLETPIVLYDDGDGLVEVAAGTLRSLGYTKVSELDGGLAGWSRDGGELFRDVNSPSKAFGELVEAQRHTPSIAARDLRRLLDERADLVVLDARREDEYRTMSVPGGISAPGAELVRRVGTAAPAAETMVVVNCAGRTRSIIGAQSLINAGVPNRVVALRNGTIGWTLEGLALEHGQTRRAPVPSPEQEADARRAARAVADRAGVQRLDGALFAQMLADFRRTTYRFDVRTPDEYRGWHPTGFRNAPGGQLVQETDVFAPVRGARIVLWDDAGSRADMTASWLAQMNWEVWVLDEPRTAVALEAGDWRPARAPLPDVPLIDAAALSAAPLHDGVLVLDLAPSPEYLRGHIPNAWWVSRPRLAEAARAWPPARAVVVTSPDGLAARYALADVVAAAGLQPSDAGVLDGGTEGWRVAGGALALGAEHLSTPIDDVYKRPYEGTDNAAEAMQAYLEWEYGLVAQLARDGTHGFRVI
jgi:rhodanese-related sulfurtransferase